MSDSESHDPGPLTIDESPEASWITRHNEQAKRQPCYRFCLSCGNCENYDSNHVKCSRCFVVVRCLCNYGIRTWVGSDGFVRYRRFGAGAFRYGAEQEQIDKGYPVRRL